MKLNPLNKILLLILFLIISLIIPIFYSTRGVTDPFLFWHIAFVEKYQYAAHFPLEDALYNPKYIPGAITMMITLSKIPGISPKTLQFLPIIGIILPVVYYTLCKKFTHSMLSACIVTLLMLNTLTPMTLFPVWPHAFGFFLFIIFIMCFFDILRKKVFEKMILLVIIFISVHFYSYTGEMWILTFMIFINILLMIPHFVTKTGWVKNKLTLNFTLAFIVFFGAFNKILYDSYIPSGRFIDTFIESSQNFFYHYGRFLPLQETEKYVYQAEPNWVLSMLGLVYLTSIGFIILLGIVISLNKLRKNKQSDKSIYNSNVILYFVITLLAVGIVDMIVYGARGIITWRYIYLIFPLLALIALEQHSSKKIFKISILLILLAIISSHTCLGWHCDMIISNPSKYSDLEPSANWFLDNSVQKNAFVDLRTGNKYLLEGVFKDMYFERHYFTLEVYRAIIENDFSLLKDIYYPNFPPYVIINKNINRIQSMEWATYEPFFKYLPEIDNNINLNKIYDDDRIWIMKT